MPRPSPRPPPVTTATPMRTVPEHLEGQQVLGPLPGADLAVVLVPLALLHVGVGADQLGREHLVDERVVAEGVDRLQQVAGQPHPA